MDGIRRRNVLGPLIQPMYLNKPCMIWYAMGAQQSSESWHLEIYRDFTTVSHDSTLLHHVTADFLDELKKKYFKIEKNHAVPSHSQHSVDGVKRRKIAAAASKADTKRAELQLGSIKRARVLENPHFGGLLAREHGESGFCGRYEDPTTVLKVFTGGWEGRNLIGLVGREE